MGRHHSKGELPLPHRLALIYLALPLAVWLLGWLKWWVGVPVTLALAVALQEALRGSWRPSISRVGLAALLVGAAWVLAVPSGGIVGDAGDWQTDRSLFLDLVRRGPPTYLVDHLRDEAVLLRYHLGYYMVPALLGRWFGPATLNWAVPLWTWCGVALVLALFVRGLSRFRAGAVALLVAIFFSGLDALEYALRWLLFNEGGVRSWEAFHDNVLVSGFWFEFSPDSPMMLEYQSHAQTLGNSPQHFITAGLGTLLLVQLRGRTRLIGVSGVVLATCVFWSSLLSIGLLPLAGALLLGNGLRPFLTWQNLLVAPALAALLGLYFTSGKTDFPAGWLWTLYSSGARLAADVAILYASEFLLLALLLWRLRSKLARDPFFLVSIAVLLAAPWWWYGSLVFSELTVRITLPAVFVLSYRASRVLAAYAAKSGRPGWFGPRIAPSRLAFVGVVCLLAAGGLSATAFYIGMVGRQHGPRYEHAGYSLLIDVRFDAQVQRSARRVSGWLAAVLADGATPVPEKGDLLFQSAARPLFDAYRMDNRLLFVTRRLCRRSGRETTRFHVRAHPADRDDLPSDRRRLGFEVLDFTSRSITEHKGSHNCVWARRLPRYDIERIVAAQSTDGDLRWMAQFHFAGGRHTATDVLFDDTAAAFAAEYVALSAQPATHQAVGRGAWNVYLHHGGIAYTKQPCAWSDGQPRFFVHVFPERAADLPEHRRRRGSGFDNLDFRFDQRGVLFDGKCLVRRTLPDYRVHRFRTGQIEATGEVLWSVDFALRDRAEETPP